MIPPVGTGTTVGRSGSGVSDLRCVSRCGRPRPRADPRGGRACRPSVTSSAVTAKLRWSRQSPSMWSSRRRSPSSRRPSLRTTARLGAFSGRMFTSSRFIPTAMQWSVTIATAHGTIPRPATSWSTQYPTLPLRKAPHAIEDTVTWPRSRPSTSTTKGMARPSRACRRRLATIWANVGATPPSGEVASQGRSHSRLRTCTSFQATTSRRRSGRRTTPPWRRTTGQTLTVRPGRGRGRRPRRASAARAAAADRAPPGRRGRPRWTRAG